MGEAVLDGGRGVFIGEPLVEVARTERVQQWVGVSFGPSFSKPGFNDGFYLNTILPYRSHYKDAASEYATGMTVDWPRRWRESRKSDPRPILKSLDHDPTFSVYYRISPAPGLFITVSSSASSRLQRQNSSAQLGLPYSEVYTHHVRGQRGLRWDSVFFTNGISVTITVVNNLLLPTQIL